MEFPVSVALLNYLLKSACDLTVPFVTAVAVVIPPQTVFFFLGGGGGILF